MNASHAQNTCMTLLLKHLRLIFQTVAAWMEPEAEKLIEEALNVNFVDVEQYPSCLDIHNRYASDWSALYHLYLSQCTPLAGCAN